MEKSTLLVGTRKGLLVLQKSGDAYKIVSDHFMGIPVNMVFSDSRTNTWWISLDHGHWGIKLHKSEDRGQTWQELEAPKYPDGTQIKDGVPASLKYIWAFAEAGADHPRKIYLGTEPGGLFETDDDGNFVLNASLWNHPSRENHWFGAGRDYPGIHSLIVDPRDSNHIYAGISVAGVFESKDRGKSWLVKNKGLRAEYLPDPSADVGHDPHLLVACKNHPDQMWQQNHCGIFKSIDGGENWLEVTDPDGPANFGFAIAVDDENPETVWVAPAVSDEIRVAVDKSLCIARTDDGGKNWQYFRDGLPQSYCYDLIYRHALIAQGNDVVFGTTTGNLFHSSDRGERWHTISNYLPMVYGLAFV